MAAITPATAFALAHQYFRAGGFSAAEALYRKILAIEPTHAAALHELGVIEYRAGRNAESLRLLQQAIALQPAESEWLFDLANTLLVMDRAQQAVEVYTRLLKLQPNLAAVHDNLGAALQRLGDFDGAVAAHRRAVELSPDFASALNNLGMALKSRASASPSATDGSGREALYVEAIRAHRRAIALQPGSAAFHNNFGNTLANAGRYDEAIAAFETALSLDPSNANALSSLARPLLEQGRIEELVAALRQAVAARPADAALHSALIRALLCHPGSGPRDALQEGFRWDQRHGSGRHALQSSHPNNRDGARRLKVGYVSADFWDHVAGRNLLPLFREHDHAVVEVYAYSIREQKDPVQDAFRSFSDHWREVGGLSDEELCARIAADGIDVLVDLALHTRGNRLTALARKPAPVQCSFAAYPGTTGLAAIDYRLTDAYLEPEEAGGAAGREQPVRLPSFWCYDPMGAQVAVSDPPVLANGYVTFGCLHLFAKINREVIPLWRQILTSTRDSRLLICTAEGSHRERFLRDLGVEKDRVEFVGEAPRVEYLARYRVVDIVLDTFPYNGHTTSLDALWMGVPVVTLAGDSPVARAGLSQLSNLGLPELVAYSAEQYVEVAIGLARDVPRLSALRQRLRSTMEASVLMDASRFAREIEQAYRQMWRRWCAGPAVSTTPTA